MTLDSLDFRRSDGTFVGTVNGLPYHIVHSDELYPEAQTLATQMGGTLPFEPEPPALTLVPKAISRRQFYQQLHVSGFISETAALAAVSVGAIPEILDTMIQSLPESARFNAKMLLAGALQFERDHPFVAQIGAAQGLSPADIDQFFIAAAALT